MKLQRLLLIAVVMGVFSPLQAQDVDVTSYIQNAGFDEDLTFQADGTMKEAVSTTTSLSDRSWAYIAADSTVYARPKSSSSQSRPDGRKMEAVNGFKGCIQGWKLWSNAAFPQCEWTYFGSVPYDLPATAVPVSDDGSTYLAVPARPTEFDGGAGFVYLRAGWSNSATFSQEVQLPCAKYRLEYWTININPNTTAVAEDLTQIKCRNEVFKKDEGGTGLLAQVWTKHEFEFTPTARFTMQFGYKAANAGSAGQPIVALDGIKLYKIGEADRADILQAMVYECDELAGQAIAAGYDGLAGQIGDYSFELEGIDTENADAFAAAIDAADVVMEKFKAALAEMENVDAMLAKMDNIMQTTDYPGKADFQTVFVKLLYYKEGPYTGEGEDFAAWILGAVKEGNKAINTYILSAGGIAGIIDGVRQRPTATAETEWQMETTYYLYNVQARRFFVGANDWNTRASIAEKGYKVRFHDPDDAAPIPDVVEIQDSVETQSAWKCVFSTNDGGAIWVDNNSDTYRFWTIENLQNGVFRISNQHLAEMAEAIQGKYLGWNGDEGDTRLYFIDPATEGAGIDWQFVSEENYQAYQAKWAAYKDQFEKAAELKTYLDQAKDMGIDVADEEAVYLNVAATIEELEAAITAVQTKINNAQAGNASVENPSDMTASILNPNFDNASYDGWKGTAPNMTGSGAHGPANVAEHFNKTFDTYQDLNAMPKGVYKLEASTAFRTNWDDHANHTNYVAHLYAKADGDTRTSAMQNFWDAMNTEPMAGMTEWGVEAFEESGTHDGVTYYVPNDPSAGRLYFEAGYYHNQLFFALDGNDPIRVGVMKNKNVTGSDWVLFDSFKLTFYGGAPEAYQFWVNQTPKIEFDENAKISKQYMQAYNASFTQSATNKAEAIAAVKNIKAAEDSIVKNMSLWNELAKEFENAQLYTIGQYAGLIAADDLGDYLMDVEDTYLSIDDNENRTQSNAELEAIIAKLKEMEKAVEAEYKNQVQPGPDMTEYLKSPGFEDGRGGATSAGWTVESKGGGNVVLGGNADNHCFEAWHSTNFDVWQEVTDLPIGVYEIEVQGYVRYLDGWDAINAKDMQPNDVPIYVYMNDSKTRFVNWFSYPKSEEFYQAVSGAMYLMDDDGWCYPDNMIAASAAFADGGYKQSAKGLVANDGDVLRIGVKGTPEAKFWPIFDNFKLTYLGFAVEVVKPELEAKIAEAAALNGVMTTKSAKETFDAAYADALEKLNSEDGKEMFRALSNLTKAYNEVEDGNALCRELVAKIEEMMTIANESVSSHVSDALTYGDGLQGQLENSELEAEDIEAAKETIRGYILLMKLPENYQEGSAEGVDVTAFIQTPSFQKTVEGVETNSIEGWEGTAGYNFGNDDTQRSALALEFYEKKFDMHQEVKGAGNVVLPNGNYIVTVNAFERVSNDTPAFFYANDQEIELIKLEDGVDPEAGEPTPNDMVSAVEAFNEGKYLRSLAVTVTDNKLRIGIKHENSSGGDWVIMDNFKLFYLGTHTEEEMISNWTVVGVDALCGSSWEPADTSNDMAFNDGYYELVKRNVLLTAYTKYEFKVVGNHDWDINYGLNGVANGQNSYFTVAQDGYYDVHFYWDYKNKKLWVQTSLTKILAEPGDVNSDGQVDITDVVLITDYILERNPQNFNVEFADVNNDGTIDVADIVTEVDVVLGRTVIRRAPAAPANHVGMLSIEGQLDMMAGEETVIPVSLTNMSPYSAFQMDVMLPEGITLEKASFTDRASKSHQLGYSKIADGKYRIVGWSLQNERFNGEMGNLLQLSLKNNGSSIVNTMVIDNIIFVTTTGVRHELNAVETFGQTTGIANMNGKNDVRTDYYDLQGRKVEKVRKGIILKSGKKSIKK